MAIIPSTGISMSMLCRTLGTYSSYLSKVVLSPNVNPAAKNKPVSYPTTAGITDNQRKSVNYGLGLSSTNTNLYSNSLAELYTLATTTDDYYYHRPQGGNLSPFRMGDYRQYDTDAKWFWENGETINQSGISATWSNTMTVNDDADILPTDLNDFSDHSSDWHYCLIAKRQGYNNYELFVGEPLFIDGSLNTQNASAEATFTSTGTYETFLTITKATSASQTLPFYFVRDSYKTYTYNPAFTPFNISVDWDYNPVFTFGTIISDYCSSVLTRFNILNVESGVSDFNFSIRIKDTSSDIITSVISASTLSDGKVSTTLSGNSFYVGDDSELNIYSIYGVITYRYNSSNYTQFFDFTNDRVSATQTEMSMSDCYTEYGTSHQ